MRKNRATRLANRIASVEKIFLLLPPLVAAARSAEGRDKLPTRRKVETHHAAIAILEAREKANGGTLPAKAAKKSTLLGKTLAAGTKVQLKENRTEEWPTESATIVSYDKPSDTYTVQVKPSDKGDDGIREITPDQILPAKKVRKFKTAEAVAP